MTQILLDHARRYPKMEPRDAVKLLYQSCFGGGHMIPDEDACRRYLLQEYAATPQARNIPLAEEIGNGMVRIHLAALDDHGYSPEQLCRDFIRSAAIRPGTGDDFLRQLSLLSRLTAEGHFSFCTEDLAAYLADYAQAGYPPVSHSETYRAAYRPAYRVVHRSVL